MSFLLKSFNQSKTKDKGFNLIELIVVVIILGIIAVIAIPAYNGIEDRAKANAVETTAATTLKEAIVADSLGATDSDFTAILDKNSTSDIKAVYLDNNDERSLVPGNEIKVEAFWATDSNIDPLISTIENEKFNVILPFNNNSGGPVDPGPGDNNDDLIEQVFLQCTGNGVNGFRPFMNNFIGEIHVINLDTNETVILNDNERFDLQVDVEYEVRVYGTNDGYFSLERADDSNLTPDDESDLMNELMMNVLPDFNMTVDDFIELMDKIGNETATNSDYVLVNEILSIAGANVGVIPPEMGPNVERCLTEAPSEVFPIHDNFAGMTVMTLSRKNDDTLDGFYYGPTLEGFTGSPGDYYVSINGGEPFTPSLPLQIDTGDNYQFAIDGTFTGFKSNGGTLLQSLDQWGNGLENSLVNLEDAFRSNQNLERIARPPLNNVESTSYMLQQTYNFNQDISDWDVSNVTNMSGMFSQANGYYGDITGWDVSNVTNMNNMFSNNYYFNQDLSGWDVSNVTNMSGMFMGTYLFNNGDQPLDWETKTGSLVNVKSMFSSAYSFNQVIKLNTSNVTDMSNLFRSTKSFNQPLITIGTTWDTSNVKNMNSMFAGAEAFNQNISDWDVTNVTNWQAFTNSSAPLYNSPENVPLKFRNIIE